jgi:hypothetical protein
LSSETRDGLHALLFQNILSFVVAHEYAHIVHGHVQKRGENGISFNEILDLGETGSLDDQVMELDADGYGGVYHGLFNFFREEVRQNAIAALQVGDYTPATQDEVLFCCFVVVVGGFLFARHPVDVTKKTSTSSPILRN